MWDASSILIYIGIPVIVLLLSAVVYFIKRTLLTVDKINDFLPKLVTKEDCGANRGNCEYIRKVANNGDVKAEVLADQLNAVKLKSIESRIDELFHMVSNRLIGKVKVE